VNGAVLTDHDLLREMYTIFPYARQHNGFPKAMEADIRNGALQMIVFEELVYQESLQRRLAIPAARLDLAEKEFRKQFATPEDYQQFLKAESYGSTEQLRSRIRRSLLIEQLLNAEVTGRSVVTIADAKAYFNQHADLFRTPESFSVQTISLLPPPKATPAQLKALRSRAEEALRQAQATKTYDEFGFLAEKISEDDYRVVMGDHKSVDRAKLPEAVVKVAQAMQPGRISDLIQVDQAYTIIRLNAHRAAGMQKFEVVKESLLPELQRKRTEQLRTSLDKKLRAKAKIEIL
jgi:parvulin-like peptidyl-prolyl isomerase